MSEWIVDIDCFWKTHEGLAPSKIQIGHIRRGENRRMLQAKISFPAFGREMVIQGFDLGFFKSIVAHNIECQFECADAEILNARGESAAVKSLIPLAITDYAVVRRRPYPGRLADPKWRIDRKCRWVSGSGGIGFQLRISEPERMANNKTIYAMSADHPLLGNMTLRDGPLGNVEYFISENLPEFVAWHGGRIVDDDGSDTDFEAISCELLGISPADKEARQQAVRAYLREIASSMTLPSEK